LFIIHCVLNFVFVEKLLLYDENEWCNMQLFLVKVMQCMCIVLIDPLNGGAIWKDL
jgi:hypothetical protein